MLEVQMTLCEDSIMLEAQMTVYEVSWF